MNGNTAYPSFKWLVGILLVILFSAISLIVNDTRNAVKEANLSVMQNTAYCQEKLESLQDKKVDKEQYYRDVNEIKDSLKSIGTKLDRIRER